MTSISVAMATYCGARHLDEQLDSLLGQSRLPDELVVRDDASTDDTVDRLRAFAGRAPFPVHLEVAPANEGPTKAFADAISRCSGDLVALADQDDVWHAGKLARVERAFAPASGPAPLLFFSDARLIDDDGKLLSGTASSWLHLTGARLRRFHADPLAEMAVTSVAPGCAMAFSNELCRQALPFPDALNDLDQPMLHDRWLALLAAALAPVIYDERPLLDYRRHAEQVTREPEGVVASAAHTTSTWASQFRADGAARCRLMARAAQMDVLVERLAALDAPLAAQATAERFARHAHQRAALPAARLRRIGPIARELAATQYRESGGPRVALADLVRTLGSSLPA